MKIKEILAYLEKKAPLAFQEDYDNSGLIIGDSQVEITGALITLDITKPVLEEAALKKCNLVISHHPLIFGGIKKINPANVTGDLILYAIQNHLCIYSVHTNLDNVLEGVNGILAKKLGLVNVRILKPLQGHLKKLVTFCPLSHADRIRTSLFEAGAGHIGAYDFCSFNSEGNGTFRALEKANPFVGEKGLMHAEKECRIEVVYPRHIEEKLIWNLLQAHPYEEAAYDCYSLTNGLLNVGAGIVGELETETDVTDFLQKVKRILDIPVLRYSGSFDNKITKVALCGGAGSFLISHAKAAGVDIFLTGDLKYHDFQQAAYNFIIADIGHYESEQFAKELIYSFLCEKFSTFAVLISERSTNYVEYL